MAQTACLPAPSAHSIQSRTFPAPTPQQLAASLHILDALLAAGYRPTVWRNVRQPDFVWWDVNANTRLSAWTLFACIRLAQCTHGERRQRRLSLPPRPDSSCHALRAGNASVVAFESVPFLHCPGAVPRSVLHIARGSVWSPATHHLWPPAFKAAARALLLALARDVGDAGSEGGDDGSAAGANLACLPAPLLLRVLQLAAAPMSTWVGADGEGW